MPAYLYRCSKCGDETTHFMDLQTHEEFGKRLKCELCQGKMVQVLRANIDKSSLK